MVRKAMACETAEELQKMAQAEGYDMTPEEAKSYFTELEDFVLDSKDLKRVAGGGCYMEGC